MRPLPWKRGRRHSKALEWFYDLVSAANVDGPPPLYWDIIDSFDAQTLQLQLGLEVHLIMFRLGVVLSRVGFVGHSADAVLLCLDSHIVLRL